MASVFEGLADAGVVDTVRQAEAGGVGEQAGAAETAWRTENRTRDRSEHMNRRGSCYDAGRVLMGQPWRPVFDRGEVRRELQIIKNDLHANSVRICGEDLDRLSIASEEAQ